ncbi:hypothetical protein [Luteolibacter sp. Populi]|uniref:hypothetical protein n=1 Tax=Luteolibacter sp. Populi TaxID=3230487 RepID=UPI003464F231
MKTWTNQAEKRLADYLDERVRREGFTSEEAVELRSDLLSHIHEEAEKDQSESIGLMQLEGILSHLDAGYQPVEPYRPVPRPLPLPAEARMEERKPWQTWRWFWGVILPVGVTLFEIIVPFCGSVFFDPVATWWHALLVLAVPLINAWLLLGARRGSERTKGIASGFAVVIAIFYALLFVPLIPASVIALVFFGLGLVSLMPVMAGYITWKIGRTAAAASNDAPLFRRGRLAGIGFALLALFLLEAPGVWTRANLQEAAHGGKDQQAAVARLRTFRSERALLLACYEGNRGTSMATDISGWCMRGWQVPVMMLGNRSDFETPDSEKVRDVFFRVTGEPFNSVKPPRMVREGGFGRGRSSAFNEMEFDEHLGGDQVAVRVKNLDLAESRFDGHVDARSRIGYGEWTMVFKNSGREAKEARCQVLLPRDGRVSRLTLWINGEPREAAFSSIAKVKAAYKEIAVVQRRDPVLVTMCGPDTVLVQCFPVPAQGEMKIRFGITAPLDGGMWELPRILERNFATSDHLEHALWVQGDAGFDLVTPGTEQRGAVRDGDGFSLSASLEPLAAMTGPTAVRMKDKDSRSSVWCEDKFAAAYERYLVREPHPSRKPAGKILLVIDGSATMAEAKPWILKTLEKFPPGEVRMLLADDSARTVSQTELKDYDFSGGRDNEPALREAVRRAKAGEVDEIVWLHGPQAVGLAQAEALIQLIERGTRRPSIHTVMAASGPNRLAEALQRSGSLKRGPALHEPQKDLYDFLTLLGSEHEEAGWHWKRSPQPPADLGQPVWDHLARQWAIDAVESPRSEVPETDRPALAAKYQLVTNVSGAVVLETKEQYDRHGLTPVDANAAPQIPGVPEASTSLLLMISAAAGLMRRRRYHGDAAA